MTVTQIIQFDKKRSKVCIDYEFAFCLYTGELKHYGIEEGREIDDDLFGELDGKVIPDRVKARTLYILKASQKTEKQLYDKLIEGGYSDRHARIGIEYAKSFGYVDDLRYAQYYVETSCAGRSMRDIRERLYRRGIDNSIIDKVLAEAEPDEEQAVWEALRKKSVTQTNVSELDFATRSRLSAYLMRRGFSPDIIRRTLHM